MSEQDGKGVDPAKPIPSKDRGGTASGKGGHHPTASELGWTGRKRAEHAKTDPRRQGAQTGWGRYLVAPRPLGLLPGGVPPIEASVLFTLLEEDPDVRPVAQVRPSRSRGLQAIAGPHPACPAIAVVSMPEERARSLAANPQVVVEVDQPLCYTPAPAAAGPGPVNDPLLTVTLQEPQTLVLHVTGRGGESVAGAHVWAIGAGGTAHGVTGPDGKAALALVADTPQSLQALYVRPVAGYWPARVVRPFLTGQGEAVVEVEALSETFEGFPGTALTGWGTQAMRLHQIPPTYRGHGIRIAMLDSGANTIHPDLNDTVRHGHDFTGAGADAGTGTWGVDLTGHGTRCAGIIAAADNRTGITGIAAEAEVYALKLFPGGHLSDLIEALDYCITHDIDIVQLSLAYGAPSQLIAWKVADARAAGITLIAPAGDTAGPVTHLAMLPAVLAVGAIAHTGSYPVGSPLAATQPPWPGPYPAPFTPTGPGVDLVAPGAAVITTSFGDGYTPADGTAIAAAHVTGLSALLLAHHDHLRAEAVSRTSARADTLYTLLRTACRPLPAADARTGAGVVDAPTALGIPSSWQHDYRAEQTYSPVHQHG